ncbi:non-hydrolyzing UDP-N-acetylglucosamine 2-epimerase [Rudaeicoccus suwonensis]|uniref:UDP-N-acetylglucosamine 2-epimerase (Non-hydrolysing) n=1 Tax=Rudaeicoccus suwonensis TaxID=657409 RepID=A0A561E8R6_9MICO|nr:UDP-N-acetylglucosamine 2-epimerase (non-hydrolyzing) [Rudaeicoccus suwonensis]TWE12014.1 UDP-N-acetylglucosamine 2-epimerase (non-hydrolysing) [Rudaeicoccus suwonensis]
MKILSVVGARPQFVKLAPIDHALAGAGAEHIIIHTGQHYDAKMSDVFFSGLRISAPDVDLAVGSGTHGRQTGAMLAGMDECLERFTPDVVLVYGDTNSTVAGALSAVKMHVPVAHLEAGLRSFNRRMPEEHNRVITDHAADLCLAPTQVAMNHLAAEGLSDRSVLVGDVMTDVFLTTLAEASSMAALPATATAGDFYLSTIHRAENTDDPARLRAIIEALSRLPHPVLLTAHPRLVATCAEFGIDLHQGAIEPVEPLDYQTLVATLCKASGVVTDSGGLQKEAFLARTPCTTVRTETEWVETVELGWNALATQPSMIDALVTRDAPTETDATPYGDGHAAERVVDALANFCGSTSSARS